MSKKIVWIFNQFAVSPDMSGGTRHYDFARELNRRGYDVYIFASDYSLQELNFKKLKKESFRIETINNIHFVWIKTLAYKKNNYKRILNQMLFAINAYGIALKLKKPDYIIGSSPQLYTALTALLLSMKYKINFIAEIRDLWPASLLALYPYMRYHPYTLLLYIIEKIIYSRAKSIIVFTEGNKKLLNNNGYRNVYCIPNGIDTQIDIDKTQVNFYNKFLNKDKFKIVYTGSIGLANNIEMILDVAEKVNKNIEFLIIGNGPMKNSIKMEIKKRNINNIKIINTIPKRDIFNFLYNIDICFITLKDIPLFKYGVSPNKLFDYMYAKKPIICAIGGWSNDTVKKAQCGIAVKPENTDYFVDAVEKLYAMDIENRNKMGNNGYRYVIEHFSRNKLIEKLIKIMRS